MKISGISMVKNADKLYYPMDAAIQSILPIVDEFIIALGDNDKDDNTRSMIEKINDPKIRIIDTKWDIDKYPRGMENAHQTDIAKNEAKGDWIFYLQADEVVHEKDLPKIHKRCEELHNDFSVEGLLFHYHHFWGDYNHVHNSHRWYRDEIRIVRNDPDIHSWESAQSFRKIPDFDGLNYRQKENTTKLKVARVDAYIYHYGWVRPPRLMARKKTALDTIHKGKKKAEEINANLKLYDYGPLNKIPKFNGTHPKVMNSWIDKFNWKDDLFYSKNDYLKKGLKRNQIHPHEKIKYRIFSWIEKIFNKNRTIGGFKNYILLNR